MILGAMMNGTIDPNAMTFYNRYVTSWFDWFPVSLGIFSTILFAYIASVFLTGEPRDRSIRREFVRQVKVFLVLSIVGGCLVFFVSWLEDVPLIKAYTQSPLSLACLAVATLLIPILFYAINKKWDVLSRFVIGGQVACILLGWFSAQYPVVLYFRTGDHVRLQDMMASPSTMNNLTIALVVGLLLVLPALGYLFYVFKLERSFPEAESR